VTHALHRLIFAALACSLLLAGCNSGFRSDVSEASSGELAPPKLDTTQSNKRAEYRLAADDIIEVSVYQVPDLNRSVQVDGSGRVLLPLVGMMQASGKTIRELEAELAKRLGERYLKSPQVAVFLKESSGQRIILEGEVKTPGLTQARGAITLMGAIAAVGGFSDTADLSSVFIIRQTEKGRTAARFDAAQIRAGTVADPQVYGGDTIVVDNSSGKMAWKYFRDTLPILQVFKYLI